MAESHRPTHRPTGIQRTRIDDSNKYPAAQIPSARYVAILSFSFCFACVLSRSGLGEGASSGHDGHRCRFQNDPLAFFVVFILGLFRFVSATFWAKFGECVSS